MADKIVSLGARDLEEVLAELEQQLTAQGVPTARRLCAAALAEEVFTAVRDAKGGAGLLRCAFPRPGTVTLQYRDRSGPLKPDLRLAQRLSRCLRTGGVSAVFYEGRCIITVDPA